VSSPPVRTFQDLVIRPFATSKEYEACTAFQEEVWGVGFNERVPAAILLVANRLGGLSAGAFDREGRLQGFVFGITGVEDGTLVHWSDMLAVRRELRDRGLGTRLKHYQREVLLSRGVRRMRWTFDPLQSRNAYVNFGKLGIVTAEYVRDMYGDTGSPLHRGIGTDRLVALWEMDSERVERRIAGLEKGPDSSLVESTPRVLSPEGPGSHPVPGDPVLDLDDPAFLLPIPADIDRIVNDDPGLASEWRVATRLVFQEYFSRGYQVREFVPHPSLSHYLLTSVKKIP